MNDEQSGSVSTNNNDESAQFQWNAITVAQTVLLLIATGLAEIGGGWLVWKTVRNDKPWWWAFIGSFILIVYGFLPTLQLVDDFGRIYAVYGGFFIVFSFLWGWALDGDRPDTGDWVGGSISMAGVLVVLFWPR